ncbi:MAG: hypothetical protein K2O89_02510 [Clostridia bacterium]|nr:hypothetical protein [Clostridia bacterium]
MIFNTIVDIEKRLNELYKFPLQQIGRNVGVARFYSMRTEELREAILAIAKGEVEPLPIYKRHIKQPHLLYNQDLVDAVLELNQANSQ